MTETEFFVPKQSILMNQKLGDIEKKYGVTIDHIHNPRQAVNTRKDAHPDFVITENLVIKTIGNYENIKRLRLDSAKIG